MRVKFLTPTSVEGTVPSALRARVALISADPALANVAIGGISLWESDGSKAKYPKGTLSVMMPKYGVLGGLPRRQDSIDEDGNESVQFVPSQSGTNQVRLIQAAVLQVWQDELRRGADPFTGTFEMALPRQPETA